MFVNSNYFIIHGSYGNPYKNWIPWLRRELSKRKLETIIPHFPNANYQNYDNWCKILNAYLEVGCINENTIFITHSLGGIFVMKFILEKKIKVKKIITVAGFNNIYFEDDDNLYKSFYLKDSELKNINNYCEEIVCITSNNDPYVGIQDADNFIVNCCGRKVLINDGGHFNEQSGYVEFRELLDFIK